MHLLCVRILRSWHCFAKSSCFLQPAHPPCQPLLVSTSVDKQCSHPRKWWHPPSLPCVSFASHGPDPSILKNLASSSALDFLPPTCLTSDLTVPPQQGSELLLSWVLAGAQLTPTAQIHSWHGCTIVQLSAVITWPWISASAWLTASRTCSKSRSSP